MRLPPKFNEEQIDFLEDIIFNRLTVLSLGFGRLFEQTKKDFEETRAQMDALRHMLRDGE